MTDVEWEGYVERILGWLHRLRPQARPGDLVCLEEVCEGLFRAQRSTKKVDVQVWLNRVDVKTGELIPAWVDYREHGV